MLVKKKREKYIVLMVTLYTYCVSQHRLLILLFNFFGGGRGGLKTYDNLSVFKNCKMCEYI